MNDIMQVKAIITDIEPAKIKFNSSEIESYIDKISENWGSLVVEKMDDDTEKFLKSLCADLNRVKKQINDFKVTAKKQVLVEVTAFENECKRLMGKLDGIYEPLKVNVDRYSVVRQEKKRAYVLNLISEIAEEQGLKKDLIGRIELLDKYLLKSTSVGEIGKGIEEQIEKIVSEENRKELRIKNIEMLCRLKSIEFGLKIPLDPLLFEQIEDEFLEDAIIACGKRTKVKQDETIHIMEKEAQAKAEANFKGREEEKIKELSKAEIDKAMAEKEEAKKGMEDAQKDVIEVAKLLDKFIPVEPTGHEPKVTVTLEITAEKVKLHALKSYMDEVGILYKKVR